MEVTLKDMVRPARSTPRRTLPCSIVDLAMARCYVPTVYFYRPPPPPPPDGSPPASNFFDAANLKAALAEVLVPFYPAAGRIRLDGNGRPEIDCNEEGVVFVEAEANAVVDDFGDFGPEHRPKYVKLVPPTADLGSDYDTSTTPLLLFQVTRFRCGGASLGVASDHLLADGFAALYLINRWAEAARGDRLAAPPLLDRGVLAARDPPTPQFPHPECEPPPPRLGQAQTPLVVRSFRLTRGDIDRLKSKCVAGHDEVAGTRCGTYEAIAAHTWRCVCIARGLPPEQKTRLYMPVSLLRRLEPPLPASYLGNAVLRAACDASVGDVAGATTQEIAGKVHRVLARMDDAYVRSAIDCLQLLQPDLQSKLRCGGHLYGSPNLQVNSWVHDADFGWGRPVFMGLTRTLSEGMAHVLPSPAADGDGLTLVIGLHRAAMERFKAIFYDYV